MIFRPQGLQLLEFYEGCRLEAYQDENGFWTIGYGHKGSDVHAGMKISMDEAEIFLEHDLNRTMELVKHALQGITLSDFQFTALCLLAYNIGYGRFKASTVLADIIVGNYAGAADAFLLWNKAAGKVSHGLVSRRAAERVLFLAQA